MNSLYRRGAFLGVCLMYAFIAGCINGSSIDGVSMHDAFKDEKVTALLNAALDKRPDKAKQLVAKGANVNALGDNGATPLLWAMLDHDIDAMRILLDLGADPNEYKPGEVGVASSFDPPVWLAAGSGQTAMLQLLLEHGGDPNQVFGTNDALMMALSHPCLDCAELLLKHGADINWSDGPESAFFVTMVYDQYGDALWVLNHGYTHDLPMARRQIEVTRPRPGQEALRAQVLEIVDRLLAAQQK